MQPWELANGQDKWMNIHDRRYGGDLAGIIERLPYLKSLGINALYLDPVFDAPSHHKYDGASLHHIDPHFGPDPAGDRALMASEQPGDPDSWAWTAADLLMLELIGEAHAAGMRVIFDGVFNHVGVNRWAFQDLLKNQQVSRFADWFTVHQWRDDAGLHAAYQRLIALRHALPALRSGGVTTLLCDDTRQVLVHLRRRRRRRGAGRDQPQRRGAGGRDRVDRSGRLDRSAQRRCRRPVVERDDAAAPRAAVGRRARRVSSPEPQRNSRPPCPMTVTST